MPSISACHPDGDGCASEQEQRSGRTRRREKNAIAEMSRMQRCRECRGFEGAKERWDLRGETCSARGERRWEGLTRDCKAVLGGDRHFEGSWGLHFCDGQGWQEIGNRIDGSQFGLLDYFRRSLPASRDACAGEVVKTMSERNVIKL
jgi:hypothetical protein